MQCQSRPLTQRDLNYKLCALLERPAAKEARRQFNNDPYLRKNYTLEIHRATSSGLNPPSTDVIVTHKQSGKKAVFDLKNFRKARLDRGNIGVLFLKKKGVLDKNTVFRAIGLFGKRNPNVYPILVENDITLYHGKGAIKKGKTKRVKRLITSFYADVKERFSRLDMFSVCSLSEPTLDMPTCSDSEGREHIATIINHDTTADRIIDSNITINSDLVIKDYHADIQTIIFDKDKDTAFSDISDILLDVPSFSCPWPSSVLHFRAYIG